MVHIDYHSGDEIADQELYTVEEAFFDLRQRVNDHYKNEKI